MDLYQSTVEYLTDLQPFKIWPGMNSILRRSASGQPRDWHLPPTASQAAGGSPEEAIPATAALACAQISIILVDDMLDDDPRGEYRRIGHGRAANYAIAFQAAAVEALLESRSSPRVSEEALKSLTQMMSTTAFGQELDVNNPSNESAYWRVVQTKSTPFYGCGFHLGALFGSAKADMANELKRLGGLYGEMIQIHDDLNDTMTVPANPDWLQGRRPLPILYALAVDHADQNRFSELFQDMTKAGALPEAQDILIRCGAISYCVDQLLRRHRQALKIVEEASLPHREEIEHLMDEIIAPVRKLFEALGVPPRAVRMNEEPGDRAE
jgi:geranylgeranyl diphosphate synthase type I